MLGLYLHIPFCSHICNYCNFNRGLFDAGLKARYVTALETEIRRALEGRGIENVEIRTTYSPAWTTDWMSDAARAKLEAYGIAPPDRTEATELIPLRRRAASVRCPYCKSVQTEEKSVFGSTACKAIWFCNNCQQPFEQFKAI